MKKHLLRAICLVITCSLFGTEKWVDTFYQYRIPITFNIPTPGVYDLQIDTNAITDAINQKEFIKFNKEHFAYPLVKIAINGKFIDGQYAMYPGKELLKNGNFSKGRWQFGIYWWGISMAYTRKYNNNITIWK